MVNKDVRVEYGDGTVRVQTDWRFGAAADDEVARELTKQLVERLMRYVSLFYKKQLDYGISNIASFGELGVVVRLSDKLERLKNLYQRKREPSNEAIEDTLYDIIGYAAILLLLRDKVWPEGCR